MNFPLIPALALPAYLFFGLPIFILIFGFIISLLLYSGIKKWLAFFWAILPTIFVAIISPEKNIFIITEIAYIAGFWVGTTVFWFIFIFPTFNEKQLYKYGTTSFGILAILSLFCVFVSIFTFPLENILTPVFLFLAIFIISSVLATYLNSIKSK